VNVIRLAGPCDIAGFRRAARASIAAGIAPSMLHFADGAEVELALDDGAFTPSCASTNDAVALPAGFVTLCEQAGLHDDPSRFDRLYELAWRIAQRRSVWADALDPQRVALERMAHAVRREIHKAHAFVRFRPVGSAADGAIEHVAWFEPSHHVVQAMAPFFVRRFASMRWAILTPRGSLRWDGERLATGPPATPRDAPGPDAGEALWLAYYRSIFNPARAMPQAMRREMPVRFWRNLPEAAQIGSLIDAAPGRTAAMLESEAADTRTRRRGVAPAVAARACERCAFAAHATQMVWGEGASDAALMLVGEQPGDREDLEGRPFVGPAGQLIRGAIAALGWPADRLYLTNAVKHFKYELRGKRRMHKTAAQLEALACLEWLEQEIHTTQPQAIVALGATAARSLLGRPVAVNEHAGTWFQRADGRPVLVTWHPAALLRAASPAQRDAMHARWLDHLRGAARFVDRRGAA
jgi:DNA polymerase